MYNPNPSAIPNQMIPMKLTPALAALVLAAAPAAFGQASAKGSDSPDVQTITQIENDWGTALLKADVAAEDRIAAPEWMFTRAACTALGLELFSADNPAASVTAVMPPQGMDSGVIVKEFKSRFGSIIANGQGSMKGKVFRIAHLGYFDFPDLFAMVAELELILKANGVPVTLGAGVAAVQKVFAEIAIEKKDPVVKQERSTHNRSQHENSGR